MLEGIESRHAPHWPGYICDALCDGHPVLREEDTPCFARRTFCDHLTRVTLDTARYRAVWDQWCVTDTPRDIARCVTDTTQHHAAVCDGHTALYRAVCDGHIATLRGV